MADGIRCKRCGHYEGTHDTGGETLGESEAKKPQRGYKKSLRECRGFLPEDPELAEQRAADARKKGGSVVRRMGAAWIQGD